MGSLWLLTGLPNSGKTRVLQSIIAETARRKKELWGHPLTRCHYLSIDPENRLKNTINYYDRALEDDYEALDEVITFVYKDSLPDPMTVDFIQDCVNQLRQRIGDMPLVITIDTIRATYSGDPEYNERDEKYVRNVLKPLKKYANTTGNIVCALHHHGWSTGRSSGSTDFWGAVDAIFSYERGKSVIGKLERIRVRGNDDYEFDAIDLIQGEDGVLATGDPVVAARNEACANMHSEDANDYMQFLTLVPVGEVNAVSKSHMRGIAIERTTMEFTSYHASLYKSSTDCTASDAVTRR